MRLGGASPSYRRRLRVPLWRMPLVEVTPEPSPEEREALERALDEAAKPEPGRSGWWREGAREAVEPDSEA